MKSPFNDSEGMFRIQKWNATFPFDFLFRRKYEIPFGSSRHREMSFFDMKFDMEESEFMDYIVSVKKHGKDVEKQLLKTIRVDKTIQRKQLEEDFENLDLSQFD